MLFPLYLGKNRKMQMSNGCGHGLALSQHPEFNEKALGIVLTYEKHSEKHWIFPLLFMKRIKWEIVKCERITWTDNANTGNEDET